MKKTEQRNKKGNQNRVSIYTGVFESKSPFCEYSSRANCPLRLVSTVHARYFSGYFGRKQCFLLLLPSSSSKDFFLLNNFHNQCVRKTLLFLLLGRCSVNVGFVSTFVPWTPLSWQSGQAYVNPSQNNACK